MAMHVRIQMLALKHCWRISTDLGFCDYHLFTYLKDYLGSQCFKNNEEVLGGVKTWLSSQAADLFITGIQKLIP
jgi:hypothetical protein